MPKLWRVRISLFLFFILVVILMPWHAIPYKPFDFRYWQQWAGYMYSHKYADIVNLHGVSYPPIILYILYLFAKTQSSIEAINQNIYFIKIVPLFFDMLPIIILCGFWQATFYRSRSGSRDSPPWRGRGGSTRVLAVEKDPSRTPAHAGFQPSSSNFPPINKHIPYWALLLNIAYLYNSIIWGQMDSIYTSFCFLAIFVAITNPLASLLLFVLALNTKLQSIIFLPVLLILWLQSVHSSKTVLKMLVSSLVLQCIIVLPFIIAGNLAKLWPTMTFAAGYYSFVSNSAHNIWWGLLLLHKLPYQIQDSETFFIFSYKVWGYIMFFTTSGVALLPLFLKALKLRKEKQKPDDTFMGLLMLVSGIIALMFFFVNTQMHERYAHPMMIFFFFYGVYSKNYWLYILSSLCYLLNMDMGAPGLLPINYSLWVFNVSANVLYYTVLVAGCYFVLFRKYSPVKEWRQLKATS